MRRCTHMIAARAEAVVTSSDQNSTILYIRQNSSATSIRPDISDFQLYWYGTTKVRNQMDPYIISGKQRMDPQISALIGIFFQWSEMIFRGDVHNHLYQTFQETKQLLERICNLGWRVLATILENVFKTCKTENNRNVTSCFAQTLLPDKTGSDATRA